MIDYTYYFNIFSDFISNPFVTALIGTMVGSLLTIRYQMKQSIENLKREIYTETIILMHSIKNYLKLKAYNREYTQQDIENYKNNISSFESKLTCLKLLSSNNKIISKANTLEILINETKLTHESIDVAINECLNLFQSDLKVKL